MDPFSNMADHSANHIFNPHFVPPPTQDIPMPGAYEDFPFAYPLPLSSPLQAPTSLSPTTPFSPAPSNNSSFPLLSATESANIFGFLDNFEESPHFEFTFQFPLTSSATHGYPSLVEGMNGGMMNISPSTSTVGLPRQQRAHPYFPLHGSMSPQQQPQTPQGVIGVNDRDFNSPVSFGQTIDQNELRKLSGVPTMYSPPSDMFPQLFDPPIHQRSASQPMARGIGMSSGSGHEREEAEKEKEEPPTKRRKVSPTTSSPIGHSSIIPQSQDVNGMEVVGDSSNKPLLSDSQRRSNHILSEQKRRNAIKVGFQDLVDLINSLEAESGITIKVNEGDEKAGVGGGLKRGRGRKAEVGGGASKSLILERAAKLVTWMERGNEGLREEVARVRKVVTNPSDS